MILKEIDNIILTDFDYDLPQEKIAQYPAEERDMSALLVYKSGEITKDTFRNINNYLPSDSLLIFNNTRVIRARLIFTKATGATIEIFCLEPIFPSGYEQSFSSKGSVEWKCIIGNLKKWKKGAISTPFIYEGIKYLMTAEKKQQAGEAWVVRFQWNCSDASFSEVIEAIGHIPLPPYINREDEETDNKRYQTVFSTVKGSVAAPTAGLHFTEDVLNKLKSKGIKTTEITLHVGAGTFQPIKSQQVHDHKMHCEHFFIRADTIKEILYHKGTIIPVGTTSVRTLESLYWLGVKILKGINNSNELISIGQWEWKENETNISVKDSLAAILLYIRENDLEFLHASTSIMIIPGYTFRLVDSIITNFHQPKSTLLLLISAWIGEEWKGIYKFALNNGFRFLSYGDSSLLIR